MQRLQFQIAINHLGNILLEGGDVVFTGESLNAIISHFSYQIVDNWDDVENLEEVLQVWEEYSVTFKRKLMENARVMNSYSLLNNQMVPLITENIASITIQFCNNNPPGPRRF